MRALVIPALLLVFLSSLAPSAIAEPTNTAAMELVQRQHLGSNLKNLAFATAQRTQTFTMVASKIGTAEATALVSKEIDSHAHQFEGQWNENLAKAYAQHFTVEELQSLASEGRNSRYIRKLSEKQGAVGESMQRMSTPVLTEYVSVVMSSAFSKVSSK